MKVGIRIIAGLILLIQLLIALPVESKPEINCGDTITADTILSEDLTCPPGVASAIVIGASGITLDLGGHTLSGFTPGNGVIAVGYEGITIKNGTIEGFNDGVFLIGTRFINVEDLTVRNLAISDPNQFIFGVHIDSSQDIIVRNVFFEFPSVAHKEAVEVFDSFVNVSNIEVQGGGAGVSFSFAGVCDPVNNPSNGTVFNSRFSDIYGAGIWIACSSNAWIEGNDFSTPPGVGVGIMGDAPFAGAVTGLTVRKNFIHDAMIGIELRGTLEADISDNMVIDNQIWGVAVRQSLGCLTPEPGWECFNSTSNMITGNQTWGNGVDLYHYEDATGNTWAGNACETTQGVEIPACNSPSPALTINYTNGRPGSFFTVEGANYPPDNLATITVNGATLGTVSTDASGELVFILDTEEAGEGDYTITAGVNPASSIRFVLDSSRPIRPQEGQAPVFVVPGGLPTRFISIPLVLR